MKSAGDPYERFRWKSSCGRLAVRTVWVKGVRHVILSDDDPRDKLRDRDRGSEKERREEKFTTTSVAAAPPPSPLPHGSVGEEDNNCYAQRVFQWLQKLPEAACQKSMSAPADGNHRQPQPTGLLQLPARYQQPDKHRSGARRPALIKTCSIPENSRRLLDDDGGRRPVEIVADYKRSMKSVIPRKRNGNTKNHNIKTELHVHMPSVCLSNSTKHDNGDGKVTVATDDDDCYYQFSIL